MSRISVALGALVSLSVACGEDGEELPSGASQFSNDASSGGAASRDAGGVTPPHADADVDQDEDAGGVLGIDLDALRSALYYETPYPPENPHTDEKALLGKILFWEEQLSVDDTVACGTCHRGAAGGSDPRSADPSATLPGPDEEVGTWDDISGSPGIARCDAEGAPLGGSVQVTERKAPSYLDAMFATRLFWDGRAECSAPGCPSPSAFEDPDHPGSILIERGAALETQAVGPPLSDVEMACEGASWLGIHEKLATVEPLALATDIPEDMAAFIAEHGSSYPALFAAAFSDEQTSGPEDEINTRRVAFAIATHERRLRSDQTPFDRFNAGDDDALTESQLRGFALYSGKANCDTCHAPPLFVDDQFHYTGFFRPEWDEGRGSVTGAEVLSAAMRTPTLRNVGLRVAGGLMHRGERLTLEQTLRIYAAGGRLDDAAIAAHGVDSGVVSFEITDEEIADMVDFLENALTDPRVADELPPFDRPTLGSE